MDRIFIADTTDGPRIIRANDMRQAKRFALDTYLRSIKRASADDLASLMESETERLLIEDATRIKFIPSVEPLPGLNGGQPVEDAQS